MFFEIIPDGFINEIGLEDGYVRVVVALDQVRMMDHLGNSQLQATQPIDDVHANTENMTCINGAFGGERV